MPKLPPPELVENIKEAMAARSPEDQARIEAVMHATHAEAMRFASDISAGGVRHPELLHGLGVFGMRAVDLAERLFGALGGNGIIFGEEPFQALDPGWLEVLYEWIKNPRRAPFGSTPAHLPIADRTTLALFGDWGTGPAGPASAMVGDVIAGQIRPDVSIHLGDVYYTGTADNEAASLLERFPAGAKGSFTLNSNHEMYPGGSGYFGTALAAPAFRAQQGTSYFALESSHFVVVCLDTAYNAPYWDLYLKGELEDGSGGAFDSAQLAYLHDLAGTGKQIVLVTHHNGSSLDGASFEPIFRQVMSALAGTESAALPVYWYWGHLHNGAVYARITDPTTGIVVEPRLIGHGAVPYGVATELTRSSRVLWSETERVSDGSVPVLNGFLSLTLDGATLEEHMIDQRGRTRWSGSGGGGRG